MMQYEEGYWDTYYQCMNCAKWTLYESDEEHHGHFFLGSKCSHCGSTKLDRQTATSKRTFDPDRAKRQEYLVKKDIEKYNKRRGIM